MTLIEHINSEGLKGADGLCERAVSSMEALSLS